MSKKFIPISHDQRKKIYALAKSAGLSNDKLHDLMPDWSSDSASGEAGTNSLSSHNGACSIKHADKIIQALEKIAGNGNGNVIPFRPAKQGDEATYQQLTRIAKLQKALGWNDARVLGFIRHTAKVNTIGDLSARGATKVITGLKKMNYTKQKKSVAEPFIGS